MPRIRYFKVWVTHLRAEGLRDSKGRTPGNVYAVMDFDHYKNFSTSVHKRASDPEWDLTLRFHYETRYAKRLDAKTLWISVYRKNRWSADDLIGSAEVDLQILATGPIDHELTLRDDEYEETGKFLFTFYMPEVNDLKIQFHDVQLQGLKYSGRVFLAFNYADDDEVEAKAVTSAKHNHSGGVTEWDYENNPIAFEAKLHMLYEWGQITIGLRQSKGIKGSALLGACQFAIKDHFTLREPEWQSHKYRIGEPNVRYSGRLLNKRGNTLAKISFGIAYVDCPRHAQMIGGVHTDTGIQGAEPLFKGAIKPHIGYQRMYADGGKGKGKGRRAAEVAASVEAREAQRNAYKELRNEVQRAVVEEQQYGEADMMKQLQKRQRRRQREERKKWREAAAVYTSTRGNDAGGTATTATAGTATTATTATAEPATTGGNTGGGGGGDGGGKTELRPLLPGWERMFDPTEQRTFYVNHVTKATQWEHPGYADGDQATVQDMQREEVVLANEQAQKDAVAGADMADVSADVSDLDDGARTAKGNAMTELDLLFAQAGSSVQAVYPVGFEVGDDGGAFDDASADVSADFSADVSADISADASCSMDGESSASSATGSASASASATESDGMGLLSGSSAGSSVSSLESATVSSAEGADGDATASTA